MFLNKGKFIISIIIIVFCQIFGFEIQWPSNETCLQFLLMQHTIYVKHISPKAPSCEHWIIIIIVFLRSVTSPNWYSKKRKLLNDYSIKQTIFLGLAGEKSATGTIVLMTEILLAYVVQVCVLLTQKSNQFNNIVHLQTVSLTGWFAQNTIYLNIEYLLLSSSGSMVFRKSRLAKYSWISYYSNRNYVGNTGSNI